MATETELKLRLQAKSLMRLKRHALFKSHQLAEPVTRRLHNIYFDTPDLALNRREMALRLRRVGGRWLQTLKGGGQVRAGLHQRNEWEVPVVSNALDFTALDAAIWDACLLPEQRAQLRPVFVTDFYRTTRLLSWQGAVIEVAMDKGEVRAKQGSSPICEVELELKSGDPRQLFELALAILEIVPFELESVSKAELGFRLLSGYVDQPVKAESVALAQNLAEGLQAQIWSCLQHLQRNAGNALSGHHAEYLHQTRVALRRLRVLLRLVEKLQRDETLTALRFEVSKACTLLGELREWDVFIQGLAIFQLPADEDFQRLLAQSIAQRDACYARLQGSDHSRTLQRLMLHFSLWMLSDYWPKAAITVPSAREFVSRHLQKLQRRWLSMSEALDELDAARLHALRIVIKKLRYSTEFFARLYDGKATRIYHAALCEVQEQLGLGNDVEVACRLLDGLANQTALLPQSQLITVLRQQFLTQREVSFEQLKADMKRLNATPVFW